MPCNSRATVWLKIDKETKQLIFLSSQAHTAIGRWLARQTSLVPTTGVGKDYVAISAGAYRITITPRGVQMSTQLGAANLDAELQQTVQLLAIALKQNQLAAAAKQLATVLSDGTPSDPNLAAQGVRELVIAL